MASELTALVRVHRDVTESSDLRRHRDISSASLPTMRLICDSVLWRSVFRLNALKSRQDWNTAWNAWVGARQRLFFGLAKIHPRIDTIGKLRPEFIPAGSRLLEADLWVGADGDARLLAQP